MSEQIIPIFPLPAVIFPGEAMSLHIFEERFKLMITDCLAGGGKGEYVPFGVTCSTPEQSFTHGCMVEIEEVIKTYDDGRFDILVRGLTRYRTLDIVEQSPYPKAEVTFFEDIESVVPPELVTQALTLHARLHEIAHGEPSSLNTPDRRLTSFYLCHSAGLDLEQRQTLLELASEKARLAYLVEYYRKVIPLVEQQQEIKSRVLLNGHLRVLKANELK